MATLVTQHSKDDVGLDEPPTKRREQPAPALALSAPEPVPRYFYGSGPDQPAVHNRNMTRESSLCFLSNFACSGASFTLDGKLYPSVEHYYQAAKFVPHAPLHAKRIRETASPAMAKRMGSGRDGPALHPNWDALKLDVMRRALRAKFTQNADIRAKLLATGTNALHEDSPTDKFWGVRGQDWLGRLLCELRDQLRAEDAAAAAKAAEPATKQE